MIKSYKYIFFLSVIITGCLGLQAKTLRLENLNRNHMITAGFVLDDDTSLKIRAIGAGADKELRTRNEHADLENMYAYCWIIDAKSREMVWRMTIDNTERFEDSDINRIFEGTVSLKAGSYEVYFYSMESSLTNMVNTYWSLRRLLERLWEKDSEWRDYSRDWEVRISGVSEVLNEREVLKLQTKLKKDVFVDLSEAGNSEVKSRGFSLKEPLRVEIYALGEQLEGKMYDYGWIVNADTWKRIWSMEDERNEHAGGATKNRVIRTRLRLKAGNYLVKYRTDDSHSFEEWNSNPPYDPSGWGLTIRPADSDYDPHIIHAFSEARVKPIVSITRVGDYAYKEESFRLTRDARLRVYAIGEGRSGDMFDYGWITEAKSGRIVWKMRYQDSRHAGGASKNRLVDEIIELKEGRYIIHYQSDDSHSYEDWNDSPPQDQDMWGISIYPLGDRDVIERIDRDEAQESILAQIVRVGDDEHIRKDFTLNRSTRIRIYCIGEGDEDEMYDYGWIENAETGRTVWKMHFSRTDHAGGAHKNRMVDTEITLDEGRYRVHYRSDDSHSYYEWNARAPFDQRNWGITLYRLD